MNYLDSAIKKFQVSTKYLLLGVAILLLLCILYSAVNSSIYATNLSITEPLSSAAQTGPNWVDLTDCSKSENKDKSECAKCESIEDEDGKPVLKCSGDINLVEDENGKKADRFYAEVVRYINYISIGIGIIAVLGLIIAGIQYSAAQENPQAIAAAKQRILNVVIGIFLYVFMFAFLQWLIPGGLF